MRSLHVLLPQPFFLALLFAPAAAGRLLVVGSANADTFLPVKRLPVEGENLTVPPGRAVEIDVPGGKGCNQAVAAAKFLCHGDVDGSHQGGGAGDFPRPIWE